jgi:hypothetical protein
MLRDARWTRVIRNEYEASLKLTKLKVQTDFTPLSVSDGDELFPNGIFEFNVTKLLAFIRDHPSQFAVEQVEIASLGAAFGTGLNEDVINTANLKNPIVLAEISPNRFNVIDGNHRVQRARREGMRYIPAYRVQAHQHVAFLTSARAYERYVEYWNSKVDDLLKDGRAR